MTKQNEKVQKVNTGKYTMTWEECQGAHERARDVLNLLADDL
jgi:hypothetical protein